VLADPFFVLVSLAQGLTRGRVQPLTGFYQ
jgi:hypothetical protein